jgi:PKD repeat protein
MRNVFWCVALIGLLQACTNPPPALVNRAPVAAFSASSPTVAVSVAVNFDARSSSDPDGDALTYTWDFGDGTPTQTGATSSHAYVAAGTYTVTLTVSDTRLTSSATRQVTVTPPVIVSEWRRVDTGTTGPTASSFQRLRVDSNARGDTVAVWEDYPARLRLSVYNAATDTWSAVTTLAQLGSFLNGARARIFPDGTAVAVWLDVPVSGAAMRWRVARFTGGSWGAASDIVTLDADVQAVLNADLQVNAGGQIALAWQTQRVSTGAYTRSYVSTTTGAGWTTQQFGNDLAGPTKIALGDNRLITLYSSRTSPASQTSSVFWTRLEGQSAWSNPQALLTTPAQFTCISNSSACYAVSAGRGGKAVALFWDAVGTFSGDGTITSKVLEPDGTAWTDITDPLGANTSLPLLRSDAVGNAVALYTTRDANNFGQLTSRRFDASTNTWTAVRTLGGFNLSSAASNDSGEVIAYGENTGPKTTVNLGSAWSAITAYEDYTTCIPRLSDVALDDAGFAVIAQVCETPTVSQPLFVRAKRFSVR